MDPRLPTGTVEVAVDAQGHPAYTIREEVAWDALERTLPALAREADAICFGTLASRAPRTAGHRAASWRAAGPGCLRVFDVNLRQAFHSPELVRTCLGLLRRPEAQRGRAAAGGRHGRASPPDPEALRARFGLRLVALTLGAPGQPSSARPAERQEEPGLPVEVLDTVGAGDAFTAALVAGLVQGLDLPVTHRRARGSPPSSAPRWAPRPTPRACLASFLV